MWKLQGSEGSFQGHDLPSWPYFEFVQGLVVCQTVERFSVELQDLVTWRDTETKFDLNTFTFCEASQVLAMVSHCFFLNVDKEQQGKYCEGVKCGPSPSWSLPSAAAAPPGKMVLT